MCVCWICSNYSVKGPVVIGKNTYIGEGSLLRNCVIGHNCTIGMLLPSICFTAAPRDLIGRLVSVWKPSIMHSLNGFWNYPSSPFLTSSSPMPLLPLHYLSPISHLTPSLSLLLSHHPLPRPLLPLHYLYCILLPHTPSLTHLSRTPSPLCLLTCPSPCRASCSPPIVSGIFFLFRTWRASWQLHLMEWCCHRGWLPHQQHCLLWPGPSLPWYSHNQWGR